MHKKKDSKEHTQQVEHLVLTYLARIRAYLFSRTGDREGSLDIAQETFVVVWKRFESFDNTRPVWPWLVGIANNLLYDYWRAKKKKFEKDSLEMFLIEKHLENNIEADDLDLFELQFEALRKCLGELPPNGHNLVKMIYEEDLKCTAVAKLLNMRPGAVRIAIHRIRNGLRTCMESRLQRGAV